MNMAGMGTAMIKGLMKKKNVASLDEISRSPRNWALRSTSARCRWTSWASRCEEMIDYPGLAVGGVATFLADAGNPQSSFSSRGITPANLEADMPEYTDREDSRLQRARVPDAHREDQPADATVAVGDVIEVHTTDPGSSVRFSRLGQDHGPRDPRDAPGTRPHPIFVKRQK